MMNDATFNLRAWASNCTELQELAAKEGRADTNITVNLLGLLWNTCTDTIGYTSKQFHLDNRPITKRSVLQLSSKIYDPLGYLSPVTIQARIFMQELWQSGVSWDEILDQEHTCYLTHVSDVPKKLHVFCDASKKAYRAVTYICQGDHVSFVIAKTRVVPMKSYTLPRLGRFSSL